MYKLESSEEVSIKELVEKYRQVTKVRKMYALKRFFKIKRGTLGVSILVLLTLLSLLSPIIAPNPNEWAHAPLSKPSWVGALVDPNRIQDRYVLDNRVSSSSDIGTEKDIGKIYSSYNISPKSKFGYMGLKFEPNDGYLDNGSAVLEFIDNTSEDITVPLEELQSPLLNISFCFKFKWDEDVPPYVAFLAFAHKFMIEVPPVYNKTVSLGVGEYLNDTINLPVTFAYSKIDVEIISPSSESLIRVAYLNKDGSVEFNETTNTSVVKTSFMVSDGDVIFVKNIGEDVIQIKILITPLGNYIYTTSINTYFNLWNVKEDREMTPEEINAYMLEHNIKVYSADLTKHGILVHKEVSLAENWVPFGYGVKIFLTGQEIYFKPVFQKGNIIVVKIVASIRVSGIFLDLRNSLDKNVKIRWAIDDARVEVQGEYYGLMGTDDKGRDIFKMIVDGLKISLLVGFTATIANIVVGVMLGLMSGYMGGKVDEIIMRIVDFFMSIPGLPLLMILAFIFFQMNVDPLLAIIVVLSIFGWAGMARTIRSQVLALRANVYVEAARASGASSFYIIRKHILPGVWPLVLMYLMVGVVGNILAEASLSFLGILRPNWNSLGKMIQEAAGISASAGGGGGMGLRAIHWVFFPGLILMLIGYSFYAISDAYDELINPKRRKRY